MKSGERASNGRFESARGHPVAQINTLTISPALLRKWHGVATRRRSGGVHGMVLALGVLALLGVTATAQAGAAAVSSHQNPISLPPTVSVGSGPTGLAYDAQNHTLYSANQTSNSLSIVDTASCNAGDSKGCAKRVGTVSIGFDSFPQGIALNPATDTIYVANAGNDTISVVNAKTCNAADLTGCAHTPPTIADPEGPGPGIAVNPLNDTVYVANAGSPYPSTAGHTVSVIDGATCNASSLSGCSQTPPTVTVGYQPVSVAVDQSSDTVYVADAGIANNSNLVSVIDGTTCNATAASGCAQVPASITVGTAPFAILLDANTHTAYTANNGGASVSVIDTATCDATTTTGCGQKTTTVPVGSNPWALTLDQAQHTVFVANNQDDTLSAVDASSCNAMVQSSCAKRPPTSQIGNGAQALATDPSTGTVYTANFSASTISVVNARTCSAATTNGCRAQAPTTSVGAAPSGVAVDTATHTVYVANPGDDTVSVLNASQCSSSDAAGCTSPSPTVHVGAGPTGVAVDQATDSVYVADNGGGTVSVINGGTCNATEQSGCMGNPPTINVGGGPSAIGVNPTTDTIYVTEGGVLQSPTARAGDTTSAGDTVSVIDGATCNATVQSGCGQTPGTVTVGAGPFGIAINPTTDSIYVANAGQFGAADSALGRTVSLIDGATCNATDHAGCGRPATTVTVGVAPFGVAVDQSTNKIYVANNTGGDSPSSLSVIDGASCDATKTSGCAGRPLELTGPGFAPNGMAFDPTNHVLYTANFYGASVSAINVASPEASRIAPQFAVGSSPEDLAVDPANHTVYVSNSLNGTVSVVAAQ
jgi:DNA-binding beta-propeller fold protein YncE